MREARPPHACTSRGRTLCASPPWPPDILRAQNSGVTIGGSHTHAPAPLQPTTLNALLAPRCGFLPSQECGKLNLVIPRFLLPSSPVSSPVIPAKAGIQGPHALRITALAPGHFAGAEFRGDDWGKPHARPSATAPPTPRPCAGRQLCFFKRMKHYIGCCCGSWH